MLKISNLKLGYGDKPVVSLNSLSVSKSDHLLITGNSGAGKTTLLYAIAGLLKPQSGEIKIDETKINSLTETQRDEFRGQNIGIIFQTLHMISAVSVLDNIMVASYMAHKSQNKERAFKLLEMLRIQDLAYRKPNKISQGQAQRVAIARAAINSPKLILGDEPTSALDDKSAEMVIKLLFDVAEKSGATLVVTSHDARIRKYFKKTLNLGATNE